MTWEQIQTAGMVVFAVLGGVVTIGKVVNLVRGWYRMIDRRHGEELIRLTEGQRILFRAVLCLLHD